MMKCSKCKDKAVVGKAMCANCAKKNTDNQKIIRQNRARKGLCTYCGKKYEGKSSTCEPCKTYSAKKSARYRREAKETGNCGQCRKAKGLDSTIKSGKIPMCEDCFIKRITTINGFNRGDWKQLKDKLYSQNHVCPYTGDILVLGENASVDHILPKARFPELICDINNIEWISLEVNYAKRDKTKEEFLELVDKIHKWQGQV